MRVRAFGLTVAAVVVAAEAALPVAADTIHLKNGRRIHSDEVRVDGDQVVFLQHGGYQRLPMSLVERIEEDDRGARAGGGNSIAGAGGTQSARAAGTTASGVASAAARPGPGVTLPDLSEMLPASTGGIDPALALQLLQALGTQSPSADGLDALAPMLGMLGGDTSLGGIANDADKVQVVLPAVTRLASTLFAAEYSAADVEAAASELIRGLESVGVSRAEIRERARQLGVPADIIDRIGNR